MLRFFPQREEKNEDFKPKKVVKSLKPDWEKALKDWKPIEVDLNLLPKKVFFIDGVRRTELRVSILDGNTFLGEGIFVSIGAGFVEIDLSQRIRSYRPQLFNGVKRYFIHNATKKINSFPPKWNIKGRGFNTVYQTVFSPDEDISAFANLLMRKLEVETFKGLKLQEDDFLLMDGTVKTTKFVPNVAYLAKDFRYIHLEEEYFEILFNLKKGQRTPAFLFEEITIYFDKSEGKFKERIVPKIGTYIKLADSDGFKRNFYPNKEIKTSFKENPFFGVARIEIPLGEDKHLAIQTLERAAAVALFFANHPLRDRRSPQNLTPIAFLEKHLRRYLGHYSLLRREIQNYLQRL
jgi:hypothetical protein